MERKRLEQIRKNVEHRQAQAEGIMDGEDNYDGADGARYMLEVCDYADELLAALDAAMKESE